MIKVLKSKIHRARLTGLNLDYEGSITIEPGLMEAANILPYEEVEVLNLNNGARFTTYAIPGPVGDNSLRLNGPAARLGCIGDTVIILSYHYIKEDETPKPTLVYVDLENRVLTIKGENPFTMPQAGR